MKIGKTPKRKKISRSGFLPASLAVLSAGLRGEPMTPGTSPVTRRG